MRKPYDIALEYENKEIIEVYFINLVIRLILIRYFKRQITF